MAEPIRVEAMQGANLARIAAAPPPSGSRVEAGQTLLEVENHKVVQEIESPVSGIFLHDLALGDFVYLDVPIAFVACESENLDALMADTKKGKAAADADWALVVGSCPIGLPDAGRAVSIAKATEIAVLGNGPGNSLQATLGAAIGPIWRSEATANFFQDKITDLVVYEASRLLTTKKFRILNSYFENGRIIQHDHVSPGVSFDEGGRLTLYAIRNADTLSLPETQDSLVDGLMRYVGRRLVIKDVATSTFTISDVMTNAFVLCIAASTLVSGRSILAIPINSSTLTSTSSPPSPGCCLW